MSTLKRLAQRRASRNRGFSAFVKGVAAATLLAYSPTALAGNILRRSSGAPPTTSASASTAGEAAAAAAAQATAALQGAQAKNSLRRALADLRRFQAAQDAARAASAAAPGNVPNGLQPYGLEPGVTHENAANNPLWQGASLPSQPSQVTPGGRTKVTVAQNQQKAILTWKTFNVGRETDLYFDQTAGKESANTWVALNRVDDPAAKPSQILGSIKAEGRVYVINRNGIIFGGTSQVNAAALLASTLDFAGASLAERNGAFMKNGLVGSRLEQSGLAAGANPEVVVEAGARLQVEPHGQVVLLGGNVLNAGFIETPDGQALLAAESGLTLSKGYLNRVYAVGSIKDGNNDIREHRATNQGLISAPRGAITMVGDSIEQYGLLTATTAADANGIIDLGMPGMRDATVTFGEGSITQVLPEVGGKKVVGVLLPGQDAPTGVYPRSEVHVYGNQIKFLDSSSLYVPSGEVTIGAPAEITETSSEASAGPPTHSIYIGAGAHLDVSGLRDVEVAMEQNTIKAELRSNELRDNPAVRDGPLRGSTIYFDARLGVEPPDPVAAAGKDGKPRVGGVADFSDYYGLVERDVAQLMTRGGNLTLQADEMIARERSVIDLSGGNLRYLDGYVRSTVLIDPSGKRVRIENAVPGVPYAGIDGEYSVGHSRWGVTELYSTGLSRARPRFEQGYVEGASAGTLTLGEGKLLRGNKRHEDPYATGAFRIFDGTIRAETIAGPKQHALPSGSTDPTRSWQERPSGAKLVVNRGGDITIANTSAPQLGDNFGPDYQGGELEAQGLKKYDHVLPAQWFDGSGFTSVDIRSGYCDNGDASFLATTNFAPGGQLTIQANVDLGDHSRDSAAAFSFDGRSVDIAQGIALRAPGGKVVISTDDTVRLQKGATIDVAGRWTNEHLAGGPARALDGGSVSLAGSIDLKAGSSMDVSAGAKVDTSGTKITPGKAGSIALDATFTRFLQPSAPDWRELTLDGALRGYAVNSGAGGTLTIATPYDISIGNQAPASGGALLRRDVIPQANRLLVSSEFFTRGGFTSYSLVGERSVTLESGTTLSPSAESLIPSSGTVDLVPDQPLFQAIAVQSPLALQVLPEGRRAPMSLSLSTIPVRTIPGQLSGAAKPQVDYSMSLTLEGGSHIVMEPGSTVKLSSANTLVANGTISALGGIIALDVAKEGNLLAKGEAAGPPTARIQINPDARLLATGYLKERLDGAMVRRSVERGGTISISVAGGLGPGIAIDSGAELNVSGEHGIADFDTHGTPTRGHTRYEEREIGSAAGSITISSDSGGTIAGVLDLHSGGEAAAGGSLSMVSTAVSADLVVAAEAPSAPAAGGPLTVAASSINASGADDLLLSTATTAGAILFDGSVALHTDRSLVLESSVVGSKFGRPAPSVVLESAYVHLKGADRDSIPPFQRPADLKGTLTVGAGLIDLEGVVRFGDTLHSIAGFTTATFSSKGDLRLVDGKADGTGDNTGSIGGQVSGGLFLDGALELQARQTYLLAHGLPQVLKDSEPGYFVRSSRTIKLTRPDGAGTEVPPAPLSFGGRLTLQAPTIEQNGVLRAPQGEIRLEGQKGPSGEPGTVTLKEDSLTSTSLNGSISPDGLAVPYGKVLADGTFTNYSSAGQAPIKSVSLDATNVAVNQGAVIDVAGGGDLLAYSFAAGNGGSRDILSSSEGFAVLPSLGSAAAPVGQTADFRDSRLRVGDSVRLQGVPGLADDWYTLLPSHYALLPGGLLVQPLGGSFASAPETRVRSDGAVIASGQRGVIGTTIRSPGYERFLVMSSDVVKKYSEIPTYSFNEYARGLASKAGVTVRTPGDAGSVVIHAAKKLAMDGTGRFGAADGLLGNLDIAAEKIAIASADKAARYADFLIIDPLALSSFGAGSVLLGGKRAAQTDPQKARGTAVAVTATDVVVDTTAASPLTGAELLLAAKHNVDVKDGSVIRAEGAASLDVNPLIFLDTVAQSNADGALLRLSAGERVAIVRDSVSAPKGTLTVGTAALSAQGSLTLDGSANVKLSLGSSLSGSQIDLASRQINLGEVPQGTEGTTLGKAQIAHLSSASSDLLLRGYDSIDLWGSLTLGERDAASGAAKLKKVTFDSVLLRGHSADGDTAQITAGELALRNSGGQLTRASGTGSLKLDVDTLSLGPGAVQIAGFRALTGSARSIEAQGSGSLDVQGALSLSSVEQISASSGVSYAVTVQGNASLNGGSGKSSSAESLGGRLRLQASNIALDTAVVLPSGTFEAEASAPGGSVHIGSRAIIDVRGTAMDFGAAAASGESVLRFAPGGNVKLEALGDLIVDSGSTIDVSGSDNGGAAGSVELVASGKAKVQGDLKGTAAEGFAGGSFSLEADTLDDFSGLNDRLERESGFNSARTFHLQQALTLESGKSITAHEVVLRSDSGLVTVAGTINAAGTEANRDGGKIQLIGGAGVLVDGKAIIDASASADDSFGGPASGELVIAATGSQAGGGYSVFVDPAAAIELSGGRRGGGSVVVRAPRDSRVSLGAKFSGARERVFQGMKTYQYASADGDLAGLVNDRWVPEASAWLASGPHDVGNADFAIGTGITVTSGDDLSVEHDIDLSKAPENSHLAFVSGKDILGRATISDGFDAGGLMRDRRSYSFDFESAGDFTLKRGVESQPKAMIRTGTGDITIRAGGDLVLGDRDSVIYTAGRRSSTAEEFLGAAGLPKKSDKSPAIVGEFPTDGGDIRLSAGGDIRAAKSSLQTTSAWLFRYGRGDGATSQQTSWSIIFDNFEQGVGALGGGDVRVSAGRDVAGLQVSIPTTGNLATQRGGGDLSLICGGDIRGGLFMLGRGRADLRAGGGVLLSDEEFHTQKTPSSPTPAGVLFELMDAAASVTAATEVTIEGAFDPLRQGLVSENSSGVDPSWFRGFTGRTALEVTSLAGTVTYANNFSSSVDRTLSVNNRNEYKVDPSQPSNVDLKLAPPTLRLSSLESSVVLKGLDMDGLGSLDLLAGRDVVVEASIKAQPFQTSALLEDATPARIFAIAGSVCAFPGGGCTPPTAGRYLNSTQFVLPKPIEVFAGLDVDGGDYNPTHRASNDLSWIRAGRDMREVAFSASGGGMAVLEAGRDFIERYRTIGTSSKASEYLDGGLICGPAPCITTSTPASAATSLQDKATDITIIAGAAGGVDYAAFANAYLDPENRAKVVRTHLKELENYMKRLGYGSMTAGELKAAFDKLPPMRRQIFLNQVYFSELKETGIDYNNPDSGRFHSYDRGFRATNLLFPNNTSSGSTPPAGNVILDAKMNETQAPGDITILAPHGQIAVGSEVNDTSQYNTGGVVTRRGGNIRMMADQNIDLYTSRVFTLQGGDILMWTTNGSITAGSGSKTSVSNAPLRYKMVDDVVSVDAFGLQTGAGIGILDALGNAQSLTRSRMDLIAPRGEVNAGEAGIRVSGDLNIAAQHVVGVENIQITGASSGVPKVEVPNLGALTSASQLTQAATAEGVGPASSEAAAAARKSLAELPSVITVEVVGYETTDNAEGSSDPKRRGQGK